MDNKYINIIDTDLKNHLKIKYPEIIYEAMQYSVFSNGKRVRPTIMLSLFESLNNNIIDKSVITFASSIELIHTYSLIHDDLPAMDNDDLRRGVPTSHIKFGEDIAILAGDALLNLSYEIIFDTLNYNGIDSAKYLANCAGVNGMVGGQVADMLLEHKDGSTLELEYVHKNKTGKLLTAAFVIPALLLNKSEYVNILEQIGNDYGLAFQILDDILDVTSTTEVLGKEVNKDSQQQKLTYVSIYGIEDSYKKYNELRSNVLNNLKTIVSPDSFCYNYIDTSFNRLS